MSIQFITYYKPLKMNKPFVKNWWLFLCRGLIAVLSGLLALVIPGPNLATLLFILGAYISVTSTLSAAAIINTRKSFTSWKWLLASVLLCILAGLIILINSFAAIVLMYLAGVSALLTGIAEIVMTIRLQNIIRGDGWYILAGVLAILFALFVFFNPFGAIAAFTVIFGIYACIAGIMLIYLSFRLKNLDSFQHETIFNLL